MIVWDMSHDAVDKVKEKQTGSGPMRASDKQTRVCRLDRQECQFQSASVIASSN